MVKDIRWKQRFENFDKAFTLFSESIDKEDYSDLEEMGLLHCFEFTFELSWKVMKDYLQNQGINVKSPRDSIKESFAIDLINDASTWLEMLEKRNELTHIYDERLVDGAIDLIKEKYFPNIKQLYLFFKEKIND